MRLLCCMAAAVMLVTGESAQAAVAISATPEPTSVAMLGTSLLGLAILMRRRFRP